MNLEVYPRGMRKVLELYSSYPQIKKLIVTESGVCYSDKQEEGRVKDKKRVKYHQKMLRNVKKAIKKGINVKGYFVWTLVDNFEWREGYAPRFGLIYNDFKTQQRIVKQSGYWFKSFLKNQKRMSKK
jgi:beta-glucosidase